MKKVIFFLSFTLSYFFANAQLPITSDIKVNTTPASNSYGSFNEIPIISMNESGQISIAWAQSSQGSNIIRVFNRAYNQQNVPLTATQTLLYNLPSNYPFEYGDTHARVAMFNNGSYIIVYAESTSNNTTSNNFSRVYYQRFNANGMPNGNRILVGNGMFPDIDIADDDSFNIVYVKGHYNNPLNAVYVKRFTSNGMELGIVTVDIQTSQNGYYNTNIRSKNGNLFAVSYQIGGISENYKIKEYNSQGTTVGPDKNISGIIRTRSFILKPNNNLIATSIKRITPHNTSNHEYKSMIQRFNSGSNAAEQALSTLNTTDYVMTKATTIGANRAGDYVVAFAKWINNDYKGIYLQQFDVNDVSVGPEYPVSDSNNTMDVASIDVGSCEFAVTWKRGADVFYRKFSLYSNLSASIDGDSEFCEGDTYSITGSTTNNDKILYHTWEIRESDINGNPTGDILYNNQINGAPSTFNFSNIPAVKCDKYYRITLRVKSICGNNMIKVNKVVRVNCKPIIQPVENQLICTNQSASIDISTTHWPVKVYQGTNLIGSFNSNPIVLSPTQTSNYTLEASSSASGICKTSIEFSIAVKHRCPTAKFEILNVLDTSIENSKYGPMTINYVCDPVIIDGSASENESGYYIRISEFDMVNWQIISDLYSGWVNGSGQAPNNINLSNLIGQASFDPNKTYMIGFSVGNPWTSADPQFIRVKDCKPQPHAEFEVLNVVATSMENSYYGPIEVKHLCAFKANIDGSASANESGYYVRVAEFDLLNWNFVQELYNDWVANTEAPSNIDLVDLISPNTFEFNKTYLVGLAVGSPWDAADPQFIKFRRCSSNGDFKPVIDDSLTKLNVFPNPTSGIVNFSVDKVVQSVDVMDLSGKHYGSYKTLNNSIDITELSNGIYILKFNFENGKSVTSKIIKK